MAQDEEAKKLKDRSSDENAENSNRSQKRLIDKLSRKPEGTNKELSATIEMSDFSDDSFSAPHSATVSSKISFLVNHFLDNLSNLNRSDPFKDIKDKRKFTVSVVKNWIEDEILYCVTDIHGNANKKE